MKEWKYLIGNADDFIGAPEWATVLSKSSSGMSVWDESSTITVGCRYQWKSGCEARKYLSEPSNPVIDNIIAQRTESFGNAIDLEFCKANPDHPDCKCKEESKVADTNNGTLTYKVELDLSGVQPPPAFIAAMTEDERNQFGDKLIARMEMAKAHHLSSKYSRPCKGVNIDVYDVLQAFAVTNPATQHAIKKLLCAGLRGHKDKMQDLTEALKSIERAIELEK